MPYRIDVHINESDAICGEDEWFGCEYEYLQLNVYNNMIQVFHNEPLTPWKSNFNEILMFNRQSAIDLAHALLKAADQMPEVTEVYRDVAQW